MVKETLPKGLKWKKGGRFGGSQVAKGMFRGLETLFLKFTSRGGKTSYYRRGEGGQWLSLPRTIKPRRKNLK